jgi:hypothetical protein
MYSTRVLPFDQIVMAAVEKLGRLLGDILVHRRSELALVRPIQSLRASRSSRPWGR